MQTLILLLNKPLVASFFYIFLFILLYIIWRFDISFFLFKVMTCNIRKPSEFQDVQNLNFDVFLFSISLIYEIKFSCCTVELEVKLRHS